MTLIELIKERDTAATRLSIAEQKLEKNEVVVFASSRLRGSGLQVWIEDSNVHVGKTEYCSGDSDFYELTIPLTAAENLESVQKYFADTDEEKVRKQAIEKAKEEQEALQWKRQQIEKLHR